MLLGIWLIFLQGLSELPCENRTRSLGREVLHSDEYNGARIALDEIKVAAAFAAIFGMK